MAAGQYQLTSGHKRVKRPYSTLLIRPYQVPGNLPVTLTKESDMKFRFIPVVAGLAALAPLASPEPAQAGAYIAGAFAGAGDAGSPVVKAGYYGYRSRRAFRRHGSRYFNGYRRGRNLYGYSGYRRYRPAYGFGTYSRPYGYGGYSRSFGYRGFRGCAYCY